MILEILIPILVALSGIAVFVIKKMLEKSISHRYNTALEELRLEHKKEIENLHQKNQREIEDIRQSYNIALEAVKSELSLALSKKTTTGRLKAEQMANILTKRTEACAILTAYCRRIMIHFAELRFYFKDKPMNLTEKTKQDEKKMVNLTIDSIEKLILAFEDAISDARMFITVSDIPIILDAKYLLKELRKVDRNKDFNITKREYLSLRESYADSVGIFTEQCYYPKTIKVPYVSLFGLDIDRHIADLRARGVMQPKDNQRKNK
jgi:hypothetical protein